MGVFLKAFDNKKTPLYGKSWSICIVRTVRLAHLLSWLKDTSFLEYKKAFLSLGFGGLSFSAPASIRQRQRSVGKLFRVPT
jgi:hypothetical protein